MINLEDCIEIGFFSRPYGYKGQLILRLKNIGFDNIEKMEWAFVIIDGLPVPFFIEEYAERSSDSLLIKLEDIQNETIARTYSNKKVFIKKTGVKVAASNEITSETVQGFTVIDQSTGKIGTADSVIENPNNPLLLILDGRKEILLPLNEEFIIDFNPKTKTILVNCPDGLLDLN